MSESRKIPLTISPFFFVTAALIGWFYSRSFTGTLIWIGIIFISILVHEFGHALAALGFGCSPRIELVAFGGLTHPRGPKLSLWKEFIVVLNGPLFGFLLFLLATFLLQFQAFRTPSVGPIVRAFQMINLFWTIVNLLPVMPLDGGQLLRIIFEGILGVKGVKLSLFLSALIAIGISLFFFFKGGFLIGALFFLFAFQNFDAYRKTRFISESDRSEDVKKELEEVESLMQMGNQADAIAHLDHIRDTAKKGILFTIATQTLSQIHYNRKEYEKSYHLLMELKGHLAPESKLILHECAYHLKDYDTVSKHSAFCFQIAPSKDVAVRAAIAEASFGKVKPTIGWLKAAMSHGLSNLEELVSGKEFENIKRDHAFIQFIESQRKSS